MRNKQAEPFDDQLAKQKVKEQLRSADAPGNKSWWDKQNRIRKVAAKSF